MHLDDCVFRPRISAHRAHRWVRHVDDNVFAHSNCGRTDITKIGPSLCHHMHNWRALGHIHMMLVQWCYSRLSTLSFNLNDNDILFYAWLDMHYLYLQHAEEKNCSNLEIQRWKMASWHPANFSKFDHNKTRNFRQICCLCCSWTLSFRPTQLPAALRTGQHLYESLRSQVFHSAQVADVD